MTRKFGKLRERGEGQGLKNFSLFQIYAAKSTKNTLLKAIFRKMDLISLVK